MTTAKILVVDDDTNLLASLKRILKRSKYDVLTAKNGKIGLRLAIESMPDLIILDVTMPGMSGHEFLRQYRRVETRLNNPLADVEATVCTPEIPVIFLTGQTRLHQQIDGLDTSAADYIAKPVNAEELRARVRNQLRRARLQKEASELMKSNLLRLENAIGDMRGLADSCRVLLGDIYTYVDIGSYTKTSELENDLQLQAKKSAQNLMQTISKIAEWPITKGT